MSLRSSSLKFIFHVPLELLIRHVNYLVLYTIYLCTQFQFPATHQLKKKGEDIDNHIATAEHFIGIGWEPIIDANFSAGTNTKKVLLIPVLN